MKKFDFAAYILLAEHIEECDRKHLNVWACTPLHGVQFIGVQVLDRRSFGSEPLPDIVSRLVKPSIMRKLKVKAIDEERNAVEYVFKWIDVGGAQ